MCGISGSYRLDGAPVDRGLLEQSIHMLRHRGPDGAGFYTDGPVGLAHARLSIIDVGGGGQPMTNEDGSLWITFNGEIFNYLELREDLLRRGHRFATQCDTEVILHLYEEMGDDCVQAMNGQWAFALWDRNRRRLFLSRDRLGVRPLFYTQARGAFLFASEIKALFAYPEVRRELDLEALDQLFTFWVTLPPRTAFRGVEELAPGHSMVVTGAGREVKRHWEPQYPDAPANGHIGEWSARLLELLTDAVRLRLRSDVPVGAYLSGGLDSTVTTALIQKVAPGRLRSFSVEFEDPAYDESAYQREAVRYLGTEHEEIRCTSRDIGRVFPEVIWHTEKPVLRTAPAPLFLLSRLVRDRGYKVVLTGEGSDEMLGGYDIFKEAKIRLFWGRHPESKLRPLLLRRLYPYLENMQAQGDAYLRAFFHARPEDLQDPFFSHACRWDLTSRLKLFFSEEMKAALAGRDVYAEMEAQLPAAYRGWNWMARAQYLEAMHLLPGYILSSQGDRVAMAHSVEARFPFLDHRVVEFASALPPTLKMRALNEKFLLKHCSEGLVPAVTRRRFKQPYRAPEAASFAGMDYADELLRPERIRRDGVFQPDAVQRLVCKARRGQPLGVKDSMALTGILSTQLVMERFISDFSRT